MGFEFNLSIAISAGIGTALVEVVLNLLLSHWLRKKYYQFTITKADKRACAEEILELINSKNFQNWYDLSNNIYSKVYLVSDRLITLNEKSASLKLDEYTSQQRFSKQLMDNILTNSPQPSEARKDFLESLQKIDTIRKELVDIARKLKNY